MNCPLLSELNRDVLAFRNAVETARGETFQRPSPTDSNVSATMALPLEAGSPGGAAAAGAAGAAAGRKKSPPQPAGVSSPAASGRAAPAGGKRSGSGGSGRAEEAGPQLLGMPRAIVDRELAMASHMQGGWRGGGSLGGSAGRDSPAVLRCRKCVPRRQLGGRVAFQGASPQPLRAGPAAN